MWDNFEKPNTQVIEISKKGKDKKTLKEIMAGNFPNLMNYILTKPKNSINSKCKNKNEEKYTKIHYNRLLKTV